MMKFILDFTGTEAVNVATVKRIYIEHVTYKEGGEIFRVTARIDDDAEETDDFFLGEFETEDEAQAFFDELITELNGCVNCESNMANSAQEGTNFNVANHSRRQSD